MKPLQMRALNAFIKESNMIEGLFHDVADSETNAYVNFLNTEHLTVDTFEKFVLVIASARLRKYPGMNVQVGAHVPELGGPVVEHRLGDLILDVMDDQVSPWRAHVRYESLHPFMDGNGRSGRVLWLWTMRRVHNMQPTSFLHQFYYQTLQNVGGL